MRVSIEVDMADILDEMGTEQIRQIADAAGLFDEDDGPPDPDLGAMYLELRRGVIGQATRDYIHAKSGRIL